MNRKRVGILIFPDVEVLDFCGPFEVFSVTRLNEEKRREELSQRVPCGGTKEPIVTSGGMRVLPAFDLADCPQLNALVVPCDWGTRKEIKNEPLLKWIAGRSRQVKLLTSVCTNFHKAGSSSRSGLMVRNLQSSVCSLEFIHPQWRG